jgi:hypothetical protein
MSQFYAVSYRGMGVLYVRLVKERPEAHFDAEMMRRVRGVKSAEDTVLETDWIPGFGSIRFHEKTWKGLAGAPNGLFFVYPNGWDCDAYQAWRHSQPFAGIKHFLP